MRELAQLEYVPDGIFFDPGPERLYVTTGHEVLVIAASTGQVVNSIPRRFGRDIAATADGSSFCIFGGPGQDPQAGLSLIDRKTLAVSGTVPLRGGFGMALSPDGRLAYVPSEGALAVVDLTKLRTSANR